MRITSFMAFEGSTISISYDATDCCWCDVVVSTCECCSQSWVPILPLLQARQVLESCTRFFEKGCQLQTYQAQQTKKNLLSQEKADDSRTGPYLYETQGQRGSPFLCLLQNVFWVKYFCFCLSSSDTKVRWNKFCLPFSGTRGLH